MLQFHRQTACTIWPALSRRFHLTLDESLFSDDDRSSFSGDFGPVFRKWISTRDTSTRKSDKMIPILISTYYSKFPDLAFVFNVLSQSSIELSSSDSMNRWELPVSNAYDRNDIIRSHRLQKLVNSNWWQWFPSQSNFGGERPSEITCYEATRWI